MRTTLNKAITSTGNKTRETVPGKDSTMNDVFRKVAEAAAAIDTTTPAIRAEYVMKLKEAQAAQEAAREAKETAENEKAFNKACDDESHGRDKEAFYRRMINDIDYNMRMDEGEYFGHVAAVESVMDAAAGEFRKVAEKAMAEIVEALKKYEATAAEADSVLEALDAAANVLQVKYRYRVIELRGWDNEYKEDPWEWEKHRVRYQNGKAHELAVMDKHNHAPATYNTVIGVAWAAASEVLERR